MQPLFQHPFEFTGRINTIEFILSLTIYVGFYVGFVFGFNYVNQNFDDLTFVYVFLLFVLLWIPLTWFLLAQATKRCHDLGKSGWFQFIPLYVFVLLFSNSDYGINKYGKNPNGKGNFHEVNDIGIHLEKTNG